MTSDKIMTADEVAKMFNVSKWLIYKLTREKKLPVVKLGKAIRYREADLLTMFQCQ